MLTQQLCLQAGPPGGNGAPPQLPEGMPQSLEDVMALMEAQRNSIAQQADPRSPFPSLIPPGGDPAQAGAPGQEERRAAVFDRLKRDLLARADPSPMEPTQVQFILLVTGCENELLWQHRRQHIAGRSTALYSCCG